MKKEITLSAKTTSVDKIKKLRRKFRTILQADGAKLQKKYVYVISPDESIGSEANAFVVLKAKYTPGGKGYISHILHRKPLYKGEPKTYTYKEKWLSEVTEYLTLPF